MNRTILISLLVCVLATSASPAFAQNPQKSIYFGPILGLNISYLGWEDFESDDQVGFCGGIFVSFALNPWFAIEPEILFSMKGGDVWYGDGSIDLDYIELPVLAKVTVPTDIGVTPTFFFGPSFAFNVHAEAEGFGYSEDIGDYVNTFDFGLVFGGGLDFALDTLKLIFDVRYTLGLLDVPDVPDYFYYYVRDADLKNSTISFMFGLGF